MACVALDLGFKAELINYNLSNICDADIAKLKVKKLIERLKRQKRKIDQIYYPEIKYDIDMIKKGGKFTLKIPKKEDLLNWLKKGIPPILSIADKRLRYASSKFLHHFVYLQYAIF